LDTTKTPKKQNPTKLVETIDYLKGLKDDEGRWKWGGYHVSGKSGYVVAFIEREIRMLRANESNRRKKGELSKKGKLTVKSE
jgi:hypothetical protein